MALLALDRLGADEARLHAFTASYAKKLRPARPEETALARTLSRNPLDALPRLSAGVGSQAFHGLIRVAYAVESGVESDLPDAVASWAIDASEVPAGDGARRFGTFAEAFHALAADDRIEVRFDGGSISRRIAKVAAVPAFLDYCGSIVAVDLAEIASICVRVFAATGDFTALHMVTACHAMRILTPYLGPEALDAFSTAILAAYVTIGRPPLRDPATRDLPDVATLCARAVASDDEHDLKLVYSALREEEHYGWGTHHLAAAVRLRMT